MNPGATKPPEPGFMDRLRTHAWVLAFVVGTFAAFGEVTFCRKNFGERYFTSLKTLAVIPLLLVFPLFWPREDPSGVLLCLALYLVRCAVHRAAILRRRRRWEAGERVPHVHTYYNGEPVLLGRFPSLGELGVKATAEPLVMLGMGLAALVFSPPLGWLFVWCAAGLFVEHRLLTLHDRAQALELADSALGSEQLAARVRTLRGEAVRIHRSDA